MCSVDSCIEHGDSYVFPGDRQPAIGARKLRVAPGSGYSGDCPDFRFTGKTKSTISIDGANCRQAGDCEKLSSGRRERYYRELAEARATEHAEALQICQIGVGR